jgi:hypothetical protein
MRVLIVETGQADLEIDRDAESAFRARTDADERRHARIVRHCSINEGATAFIAPTKQAE